MHKLSLLLVINLFVFPLLGARTPQKNSKKPKIVLVTGASSGIGRSIAFELNKRGYIVYATVRELSQVDDLKKEGIHIIQLDITDEKLVYSCVDKIIKKEGRIDVLINNAGIGVYGSAEETLIKHARYQFDVNLFGPALLIKLVLPYMRKQRSGTIINISSVVGKIHLPLGGWYVASKHGLEGYSDSLRMEVAPFGIQVIIIQPGIINTNFGKSIYKPLMQRSGKGPYKYLVNKMKNYLEPKSKKNNGLRGSHPSVVATKVANVLEKRRPATRYAVGKYAKLFLFIRKWSSDRFYEWLIRKMF